jgi:Xaa-Pro aminopeptidase
MAQQEVQAYVIPSEDAHASEYPPESDLRRGFITGFTGSAGTAIVTTTPPITGEAATQGGKGEPEALLFTDGRYFLQAGQQLQPEVWKLMKQGEEGVPTWTGESSIA